MTNRNLLGQSDVSDEESQRQLAETPALDDDGDLIVTFDPYMNPEFTQRLIEHMHRAKIAALRDLEK